MDQLSICRKKLILKVKPQKLKNRSFFENLSRHSMHPIIYRWMEREKTFLYFYKCDSPQSQWIKYESISEHLVHRHCQSFFTIAMGGQIQKLFIGDLRLKRFVIKFLAHSLVKVHMILHKKLKNSWRIAKWKCLSWRCNNRIRRTSEVEVKIELLWSVLMILNVRSREFIKNDSSSHVP